MSDQPQPHAASVLEHLTGHRLPGGCDDCDAYQTVTQHGDGVYVLTVRHDETCPFYIGATR